MMIRNFPKLLLPNRPLPMRILCGPFRGARLMLNPRNSLRKVFGLYERELNNWLAAALQCCDRVLDVGANDGYFTFGCMAAFGRLGKAGEIIAFEPEQEYVNLLQESIDKQPPEIRRQITIMRTLAAGQTSPETTMLDSVRWRIGDPESRAQTLIKIDVEGAELEVLNGALSWLNPSNYFVIEVHEETFLERIKRLFASRDLRLTRINQRPLPLLGGELRQGTNWWLVSELNRIQ
jgi:hypothetical protein